MDIAIHPSASVQSIFLALPLFMVIAGLLLRGRPLLHRILPAVLVALLCAGVYFQAVMMRFSWNREGIVESMFGTGQSIPWSAIRLARVIERYRDSEYRPVSRNGGACFDGHCGGRFLLANGMTLRVFLDPAAKDAMLVTTEKAAFLYAPEPFEQFRRTVEANVKKAGGKS